MRLTTHQLSAVLHAITIVTAGDYDGWTAHQAAALDVAEDKVRRALHARRDYARVNASIEADVARMLANPEGSGR